MQPGCSFGGDLLFSMFFLALFKVGAFWMMFSFLDLT